MSSICFGKLLELCVEKRFCVSFSSYVYVYSEYLQNQQPSNQTETIECFEPKLVHLERTGTIKIVTISALISHFLPYFNSSINPVIYNIMSGKTTPFARR